MEATGPGIKASNWFVTSSSARSNSQNESVRQLAPRCYEAKLNRISETAYRSGLVVAYDIKGAMDNWTPDSSFIDDFRVLHFCQEDIFTWYRQGDDEAEGDEKHAIPTELAEYQEEFQEWLMNAPLFRYVGPDLPPTPREVLPLLNERCFFAPMFFWHCGKFIEPFRDLAVDGVLEMSGNTELKAH